MSMNDQKLAALIEAAKQVELAANGTDDYTMRQSIILLAKAVAEYEAIKEQSQPKRVITLDADGMFGRNSFASKISNNFKAIREAKGMTHEEAAKGMKLPVSSIYDLESWTEPNIRSVTNACDFYGCTPNDVLMTNEPSSNSI